MSVDRDSSSEDEGEEDGSDCDEGAESDDELALPACDSSFALQTYVRGSDRAIDADWRIASASLGSLLYPSTQFLAWITDVYNFVMPRVSLQHLLRVSWASDWLEPTTRI